MEIRSLGESLRSDEESAADNKMLLGWRQQRNLTLRERGLCPFRVLSAHQSQSWHLWVSAHLQVPFLKKMKALKPGDATR